MSVPLITHEQSSDTKLSANLQIAIGHIEAAAWAMKNATYNDPSDGITDADWLLQIVELLKELDPATRSARCRNCGGSQLIYCEEVDLHHKLIDADARSWRFSGDSDVHETGGWHIKCGSCGDVLCTDDKDRGFGHIHVICDDVTVVDDWD